MLLTKKAIKITGFILGGFMTLYLLCLLVAGLYINHRKQQIINYITAELALRLKGKAMIRDIDISVWTNFPAIDFRLNGFTLSDSVYRQPAIAAQTVSTSFSILQLIQGKIVINDVFIEDGQVHFFTDSIGYTNQYLLSVSKTKEDSGQTTNGNRLAIEKLRLKNVSVFVEDRTKEKEISFAIHSLTARITPVDSSLEIRLSEKITMKKGLGFNLAKGAFLESQTLNGNWLIQFNIKTRTISFNNASVAISKQPFQLSGRFTLDKTNPSFAIHFNVKQVPYSLAKDILTAHIRKKLELANVQAPLDANGTIEGSLLPAREPAISINWQTINNTVLTDAGRFNKCSFTGNFMNTLNPAAAHVDSNSRISFTRFSGEWEGIPFTADSTSITNLDSARLQMHVMSQCTLKDVDNKLAMNDIAFKDGIATFNLWYDGPIVQDQPILQNVQGTMAIQNGSVDYVPRGFAFTNCNGTVELYKDSIRMNGFNCNFGDSKFNVNISSKNFRRKSTNGDASQTATIDCFIHSPFINLDAFNSLFDKRKPGNTGKKVKGSFAATARIIDDMLDNSVVGVHVNAEGFKHGNLRANHLDAVVKFEPDYWELTRIALNLAGGNIVSSGRVEHTSNDSHTAFFNIKVNNVEVSQLLFAFDDFGQDALTHDHLSGRFSTLAALEARISAKGHIMPASMKGTMDFTLLNATLQNFDAFDNLKPFLIKNRDMSTVRFAELKDKIALNGENVFINRMEVQSSAFRLFLEGNYGLAKKNTDLLIQVPFSNLNKNSFDSAAGPANKGIEAKKGASIWLRAANREDGKVKVKLTMSKKLKAGKKEG